MRLFFFVLLMLTNSIIKLFAASDDFQNFIEKQMDARTNIPIYFYEPSADQEKNNTNISKIFYRSESLSNNNILNLVDKILSDIGDVVCIQNILSDDDAYILYLGLKKNYAHFLYVPPAKILNSSESGSSKGLLMASKFSIKIPQFYSFKDPTNDKEGFFDFVIENKGEFLGHIYATNLTQNNCEEKIVKIKDKIQDDLSKNDMAMMPFLLFGALNNGQPSAELKNSLYEYFAPNEDGSNCILLVRDITFFPKIENTSSKEYRLSDTPQSNSQVIIKPLSNNLRLFKNQKNRTSGKNLKIISHKSHNENQDNKPGYEVTVGAHCDWGGEEGPHYGFDASAEVHDGQGNFGKFDFEQNNDGQGKIDISAGHKSDTPDHK